MTRRLAAAALTAAALAGTAFVAPALACTIDTCSYTQPFCNLHLVECTDVVPLTELDCVRTVAARICLPNPPPIR